MPFELVDAVLAETGRVQRGRVQRGRVQRGRVQRRLRELPSRVWGP